MDDTLHSDGGQKYRGLELVAEDGCLTPILVNKNNLGGESICTSRLRAVQSRSIRGMIAHLSKALRLAS